MFENGNWGKTQYLLERSMDVETTRRKVIADNIANADTPHFKRSEITFEASLKRALDTEDYIKSEAVPARMTDSRHIPFFQPVDYHTVKPRLHLDYLTSMRNDGNNIDPEKETQDMLENQLRYQALTQIWSNNDRLMQTVMRTA
ncbi:MAG: flagellar basal body rod protein FlgB [Spirochaetia bacterium]|nr:flagellar basal body rod protein FlgB [Spirochaetia bacterium]